MRTKVKKGMPKRLGAAICAAALVVTMFTGCNGSTSSGKKGVAVEGEDGPFAAYAEPLTLSVLKRELAGTAYPKGDNASDNILTRFITEKLNVNFDCSWVVDQSQYADQVDLAIASNSALPDIYFVDRRQLYVQATSGQIWDMKELYEKYASDSLKETLSYADSQGIECGTVADGLYGIPQTSDVGDGVSLVFIRKDWLNKLNLEVPKSLNELADVAKAFIDNNVSGSPAGTMGISMAGLGFTWDVFANAHGAYPNLWTEDGNDGLVYGSLSNNVKGALTQLKTLYDSGVIHPEFAAMQASRLAQYVAQGRLGIFIGPFWYNNNYIINNMSADESAEWIVVSNLPLNEGESVASRSWDSAYRWMVVNKNCANPEAAIKVLNMYLEMKHGEYADWWFELQKSDEYISYDMKCWTPIYFAPALKNCQTAVNLANALESGDTSSLSAEERFNYNELMDNPKESAVYRSAYLTWMGEFKQLNNMLDTLVYDAYKGPVDTTYSAMMKTLQEYETGIFVDMIMGKRSIDDFNKFVEEWYAQGGEMVTKTVNDWYKEK